jgi:hypothetical protein
MHEHGAGVDKQMSVNSWICYWYKDTKWKKDSNINEGAPLLGRLLEGQMLQHSHVKERAGRESDQHGPLRELQFSITLLAISEPCF